MARHRVRLDVKLAGEPWARVHPAQIQQVLLNLLINARQAMPEGGTVRVRLGLDAGGRRAELSVADTGVGIAPGDLRRIFEPFYSTKTVARRRGAGGHRPGPGRLPRHRRGPPRPPPRREPPGPGLDVHPDPPRLPARRPPPRSKGRREHRPGQQERLVSDELTPQFDPAVDARGSRGASRRLAGAVPRAPRLGGSSPLRGPGSDAAAGRLGVRTLGLLGFPPGRHPAGPRPRPVHRPPGDERADQGRT